MAITNLDGWIAAAKQTVNITRTASVTSIALMNTQCFQAAGSPGAGTLAGTSVTAGVVQTDALAGYPIINAFGGSAGYISALEATNTVVGKLRLYDCLWKGGAYPFNAAQTLSAQPSYSGRVPGGTDFTNTEIWIEAVTAFTGNQTITVTYTNQSGTTARTTGAIATGVAPIIGRMLQLPLQAGDTGVQKIESVTSTVSTVGTFNVLVMRKLWQGRIKFANDVISADFLQLGMPQIWADSALNLIVQPDSTATGLPDIGIDIVNG